MSDFSTSEAPQKVPLASLPTPLEPLTALTRVLGGPEIWVKRDDGTGLAGGGNKARKLEYLMAEALALGADTIVTAGGIQSNHARQTAAAAARLGLRCILVLTDSVPDRSSAYHKSANLLLDRLFGADIRFLDGSADPDAAMADIAARCEAEGRCPYVIPVGGSNAVGARAYVDAAAEVLDQAAALGVRFSHVVLATGSGGTHAGLVVGFAAREVDLPVLGVSVSRKREEAIHRVRGLVEKTAAVVGSEGFSDILIDDRFVGPGYGMPTEAMAEAVRLVARTEGLLLDPVYTGKAMAGLIALIREGTFRPDDRVLFWHTGGSVALFAYDEVFASDGA
ncbi:D-cysteine desulfhydrase family protein [Microvirga alba]|uniref:L-cysteate sulfo-lyase n=1 Tax=Microvirga alba TaxID=2791025 RepID=A0A931FP77_9HYPH|nr:D-cysteine desulfhydrase [Microvirga alba]MBF9233167.1 D-cysteine desulfhydrase [Microvirga alba]